MKNGRGTSAETDGAYEKEAVREFLGSDEFETKVGRLQGIDLLNGFRMGIAQVRDLLEDDDELIPKLEKLKFNPNVEFKKEPTSKIVGEPNVWSKDFETDPMKFIKE
ncbi:hypothetical protein Dimus_010864 [Dionaea muscipula]